MLSSGDGAPGVDGSSAELDKLRNQVVAQARELAVIRWELSSLMRQHPVTARVAQAKSSILRRFPKHADKVRQVRQAARGLAAALRPRPPGDSRPGGTVDVGPSRSFRG